MTFTPFMPDFIFKKTTNISVEFLKQHNIKCLFLDVDNTLAAHGSQQPAEGIVPWLREMEKNGIKLIITSNNYEKRVAPFAKTVGLDFVSFSAKPTPYGFIKAAKKTGEKFKNTMVVGDQVFTDIYGARLLGMKSAMVLPIHKDKGLGFAIKRKFEKGYLENYLKTKGEYL